MDNKEFIKEATGFVQSTYDRFESYQKIVNEILIEFNRVCNKKGVKYWLAYGTLLGAIRDKGQVPWDYDVDVWSFFDDCGKLIDALESELPNEFYYTYVTNTDHYPGGYRLLRVCKKGYSMMAIHVDVFFMVGACDNERKMKKYSKRLLRYQFIFDTKCLPYHYKAYIKDKANRYLNKVYEILYSFIPLSILKRLELSHLNKYPVNKKVFVLDNAVIPTDAFGTEYVVINGNKFPIPSGYDIILQTLYGDYNQYPSIESRLWEFYRHTKEIDTIQALYNHNRYDK